MADAGFPVAHAGEVLTLKDTEFRSNNLWFFMVFAGLIIIRLFFH